MGESRTYMMRAIDLAKRAQGHTSPNPMVGCVIVRDGRIVGEGFHARPGAAHAEAAALRAAGADAKGATAYVTLEPCNHFGRTPPCAEALIKAGIAEVYFAVADPNPLAAGGAETLRSAGVKVEQGLCAEEAHILVQYWLHHQRTARPYVIAKYAASLDGKIATRTGDSKWITSKAARLRAHDLRHACDALIVGVDTIIADNPSLTARPHLPSGAAGASHPLRVILDSHGRTPPDAKILSATTPGRTLIATTSAMPMIRQQAYQAQGAEILVLPAVNARPCVSSLLQALGRKDILSIMIEGGSKVLGAFFDAGLVDEVWAFIAPIIIGGPGPSPIAGHGIERIAEAASLNNITTETYDGTILLQGRLESSPKEVVCSQAS
ncbi:MAG: bifunctional diaminohydroxyphosphoribosylaminopyrimidine deaminase/5-amino-6-(5-phosphoribosylamino)uracil reductase RibD [bacterium]